MSQLCVGSFAWRRESGDPVRAGPSCAKADFVLVAVLPKGEVSFVAVLRKADDSRGAVLFGIRWLNPGLNRERSRTTNGIDQLSGRAVGADGRFSADQQLSFRSFNRFGIRDFQVKRFANSGTIADDRTAVGFEGVENLQVFADS